MHSPLAGVESGGICTELDVLVQGFSSYLRGLRKSEHTIRAYANDVTLWARWFQRPPEFFKQEEWDDWIAWQGEQQLSGATVSRHARGVKRFFKYLRRRKLVEHDPSADSESVQRVDVKPEVLSLGQVALMKGKANTPRLRTLMALLYDCGLRNAEARSIQPESVNAEYLAVTGKRSLTRFIPLSGETKAHLEQLPLKANERTICRAIDELAYQAGIKQRVYPHLLRHSRATHLLNSGVDIRFIQEFLGHTNIESTKMYTHVAKEVLRQVILKSSETAGTWPRIDVNHS